MTTAPPRIGVALSGGGSRAAAFALGGLRALHDLDLLKNLVVVSGISGGSITAAAYGYGVGPFDEFDHTMVRELSEGFQRDLLQAIFSPPYLLRRGGASGRWALATVGLSRSRESYNRTDALAHVFRRRLFDRRLLQDGPRRAEVVLTATDLHTMNAVRFGSHASACSRFGTITEPIEIADAVAASAAFPLLLPPVERSFTFQDPRGEVRRESVRLSDGGIYDNLGTSVFERGRSSAYTPHVYDIDYLFVLDAGRGRLAPTARTFGPLRLKRVFDVTYRKAQDRSRGHLYDALAAGHFRGVIHAYLGMPDERLPVPIADLVPADAVRTYGTNFAPMSPGALDAIAARAEQLVRALTTYYCPRLLER
jgi:predicted acylesterase/phospholipase RssA